MSDLTEAREPYDARVGVVLMSFGTAATLDDVPTYLASVRGGRPAPDGLVAEFRRRFARVGGSPLIRITLEQATALETLLNAESRHGSRFRVTAGMRHAPPFIRDSLLGLAMEGIRQIIGIILSPQYSPIIMGGYLRAVEEARSILPADVRLVVAGPWHDVPAFPDALAERVVDAMARLPNHERDRLPVLFTAHSIPRSVAEGEPSYIQQLHDTACAVADRLGLPPDRWQLAYQSAGHTTELWLSPDVKDVLPALRTAGHRTALVAPIQFVSDHLEVLYDIDVAAREEAESCGVTLVRTESLNTMPAFVRALADVVRREHF
ncbi:MAG: ferrochelatase [Chloroflexi bacterium]|nr:ferrochelatase [Chloroflexota bacterium]